MRKNMKISDLLQKKEVTISCELFPPKKGSELEKAHEIVREMAKVKPSFMSVTYGASGGISEHTVDLANEVQNVNGVLALAHLTCASSGRDKIQEVLKELKEHQIENILALRGDIPEHVEFPLPNQYHHASELIEEIKNFGDFCIGGACYPEGHPEAESLEADIDNLKRKVEAGCEFLTTQMFFDNNILYNFLYRTLKRGIEVPVIAGIMPVTNVKQIRRITSLSGTILPQRFRAIVERFADHPAALKQAGIAYATDQIIDLIANGVNHVHIYTMNKPDVAGAIFRNLSEIYNLPGQ
jgi:methylenetetrahydrofolate reductase (NADPH)